jgi:hypothetical protein
LSSKILDCNLRYEMRRRNHGDFFWSSSKRNSQENWPMNFANLQTAAKRVALQSFWADRSEVIIAKMPWRCSCAANEHATRHDRGVR